MVARNQNAGKRGRGDASEAVHKPYRVAQEKPASDVGERASSVGAALFTLALFAIVFCVVVVVSALVAGAVTVIGIVAALVLALLVAMSMHIAQEWERVVVLRFGAFNRVSGPGLFWTIPFVEQNVARIDMRTRATTFGAEGTLTSDLVPLDVDAVLFWVVYNAKTACLEVRDFSSAVELAAQASLREAIGRLSAAQVAIKREQLDREIKDELAEQVGDWGVSILSVEVRDVLLPDDLQDAMSAEAQAEQRMKGRLILAEAERDISDMLVEAAQPYEENPDAMRLRSMHMLYESVRDTGGTVVMPSSFADGLGDVLPEETKAKLR